MAARYAIYYAPPADSLLGELGAQWLGRDAASGRTLPAPASGGLAPSRWTAVTEAPRHYGFHGTLKPPFHLVAGADVDGLHAAVARFAASRRPFTLDTLEVAVIGDFIALTSTTTDSALVDLAGGCVEVFEPFRAPPSPAETARRKSAKLTPRQETLLARWGYPYVFDEFRFHLSLTGAIADARKRMALVRQLEAMFAPALSSPVPVFDLCLFTQADRSAPFRIAGRFPFGS